MYRPSKGWEQTVRTIIDDLSKQGTADLTRRVLIEAGADAMLKALKDRGKYRTYPVDDYVKEIRGWATFIPDEH